MSGVLSWYLFSLVLAAIIAYFVSPSDMLNIGVTLTVSFWVLFWMVVDFKDKTLNPMLPNEYSTCPNQKDKTITCSVCQKCWNKKVKAVVFEQH